MDFGDENDYSKCNYRNESDLDKEIEDILINVENVEVREDEEYVDIEESELVENSEELKILNNLNSDYESLLHSVEMNILNALNSSRLSDMTNMENTSAYKIKSKSVFGKSFRKSYFTLTNGESFRKLIPKTNKSCEELANRKWSEKEIMILNNSVLKHQQQYLIDDYINSLSNGSGEIPDSELINFQEKVKTLKEMPINYELLTHLNWISISSDLENRNSNECFIFFANNCDKNVNKSKWSEKEEILLMKLVEKYKECNWLKIAKEMNTNRTPVECLKHYQVYIYIYNIIL